MQTFLKRILVFWAFALFTQCDEPDVSRQPYPADVWSFLDQVNKDPILIDGTRLGDSWRVIRYEYAYWDGEYRKEGDIDYLNNSECRNYQEFWIFDWKQVMLAYKGECFDKDWDGYYVKFDQFFDAGKNILKIDYVYDGGEKQYSRYWEVISISETTLVLSEDDDSGDFIRYTFRREKL